MTEVTETVRNKVNGEKIMKWVSDNMWFAFFILSFTFLLYSLASSAYQHKQEVQEISKQNAACIYLESSDLGEGQHYMICEGQIILKRLSDGTEEQLTPEQQLEEVVPTEASNGTTPPAK